MIWQDYTIVIAQVLMCAALFPMLSRSAPLPPVKTCWATTLGLAIMAGSLFTLKLPLSGGLTVFAAVIWFAVSLRAGR